MSRLCQPPCDRRSGDAAADDDDAGGSCAASRGLVHHFFLRWLPAHFDATLYSMLSAGQRCWARVRALTGAARYTPVRSSPLTSAKNPPGSPMRNLLGRLHARRLPELLRIAEAWSVPLYVESKSEVVGALYRAMIDPRTMRDVWDRLDPPERAMVTALTDASDAEMAPTVDELAARLEVAAPEAREMALRLYRAGILARDGDDEPLPIGAVPRLL